MDDIAAVDLGDGKRLRPYQVGLIRSLREAVAGGARRIIVNAPTGAGKTVIASALIKLSAARGKRSLFIAPRRELIKQTAAHLAFCDVRFSYIAAGFDYMAGSDCYVVSKDTLASRALRRQVISVPNVQLAIIDECHSSVALEYSRLLAAIEKENPSVVMIGLSATPGRADGRGLGDIWQKIVCAASYSQLISDGYLVPCRVFAADAIDMRGVRSPEWDRVAASKVDRPKLVGDVVLNWERIAYGRKTIVFGATVAHAVHLRDCFVAAGHRAAVLDQSTPMDIRDQMIEDLRSGAIDVLCNCDVLSIGFDEPTVSCIVLACPSRSLVRYRQRAGRALRPSPGKEDCVILDHASAVVMHGFPDEDIEWPLEKSKCVDHEHQRRRLIGKTREPIICRNCGYAYTGRPSCPMCGSRNCRLGRAIAIEKGLLKEARRVLKAHKGDNSAEAMRQFWIHCLAVAANKGRSCGAAAAMFAKQFHITPWDAPCELPCLPRFDQWRIGAADMFPQFIRRKEHGFRR